MEFSRSDIGKGRNTLVLSRCQDVWTAATENVASLSDYGVSQAKLNALKKKIENFQVVQAKPRHGRATSSSATKELTKLFKQVDELLNELLNERLDALAVQFKDSQPAFFNAYNSARRIVESAGGRSSKEASESALLPKAA